MDEKKTEERRTNGRNESANLFGPGRQERCFFGYCQDVDEPEEAKRWTILDEFTETYKIYQSLD